MKYKSLDKLGLNKTEIKKDHKFLRFINKTLMAVFLGLVFLIVMEYSPKFKNFMQNDVLNKNISFGFIGKLYNKYFGEVMPNTSSDVVQVFKEKINYSNKEKYYDGYKLTVENNYLVPIIKSGIVVFIGEKENYGKTIVVECEDKTTITYGNIKSSDVKLYESVNAGKYLGEVNDNFLYLIVQKDGEYLDIEKYLS